VTFRNNIVVGSTGGVATYNQNSTTIILSDCNSFWENEGGNYEGGTSPWPQAATDFFADPLFCSPADLDFTLDASSPCAPDSPQGCGLVGALNVACGIISVERSSWGSIKALYR
jgi:hypothetical protein